MAKTKISEYSTTNSSNTDIEGINIAEGCAPSGINNAIRELMVHLKEFQTGTSGDPLTVAGSLVASGGGTLSGGFTVSGTNTLSGTNIISGTINSSGANTFSGTNIFSGAINSSGTNTFSGSTVLSNASITGGSISGITDLAVADGGTGASSFTANSVVLGNGTSALNGNLVAPGTSGNVLTSNGTTWSSAAPSGGITATTGSAPYYAARAWVNFDGTASPITIRASVNVSSITDNGTGDYSVNFTTAMPDANYVGVVGANRSGSSTKTAYGGPSTGSGNPTTSAFRFVVQNDAGSNDDGPIVMCVIFR